MGSGDGGLVTSGRWLSAPFDGGIEPREVRFRVTFHWRSASASARPPVLIADRRPVSRQLIRFLLEQDRFDVLGEASTVTEVLRSVTTHRPDALVVNDNVPAAPGTDPIREIRRLSPSTKVVLISSGRLEGSPWQGADAILEEEVSVRQLTRVLAQILAGVAVIAPAAISIEGPGEAAPSATASRPGRRSMAGRWVARLQGAVAACILVLAFVVAHSSGPVGPSTGDRSVRLDAAYSSLERLVDALEQGASPADISAAAGRLVVLRAEAIAAGVSVEQLDAAIRSQIPDLLSSVPDPIAATVTTVLGDVLTQGPPPPTTSPEPSPTVEPSPSPEPSPNPEPSPVPDTNPAPPPQPEPSPSSEPSPEPSASPSPEPSPSPIPEPSPSPSPSPEPSLSPSPSPSETPSPSPSETPSPSPSETPSPSPTETPSPEPSESPTPSPEDGDPDNGSSGGLAVALFAAVPLSTYLARRRARPR